jgi:hypothetical protein
MATAEAIALPRGLLLLSGRESGEEEGGEAERIWHRGEEGGGVGGGELALRRSEMDEARCRPSASQRTGISNGVAGGRVQLWTGGCGSGEEEGDGDSDGGGDGVEEEERESEVR